MTEHLGHEKHQQTESGNIRNGTRSKTVLTEAGPGEIDVPRDREGSFDPKSVKKRPRRLAGVDEIVLSLTARGLTGEVAARFDDVFGASVSSTWVCGKAGQVPIEPPRMPVGPRKAYKDHELGCAFASSAGLSALALDS